MESLEQLSYETALRALDKQERLLAELRAQTATVVAVSSLAVTFLGRFALAGARWGAVATFALATLAGLCVLVPRRSVATSLFGGGVFERYYSLRDNPAEIRSRLAYDLEWFWDQNDRVIGRVSRGVQVSIAALLAELLFLVAAVSDTIV